jgi:hypothetical protein
MMCGNFWKLVSCSLVAWESCLCGNRRLWYCFFAGVAEVSFFEDTTLGHWVGNRMDNDVLKQRSVLTFKAWRVHAILFFGRFETCGPRQAEIRLPSDSVLFQKNEISKPKNHYWGTRFQCTFLNVSKRSLFIWPLHLEEVKICVRGNR